MARQSVDIIGLREDERTGGYRFEWDDVEYRVTCEYGAWRLERFVVGEDIEARLCGSMGEAMAMAVEWGSWVEG